jgi:fumarate hydratase class II
MICARVIGNDTTLTVAGQSGNFQLNVMLPLIGDTLLESIELLSAGMRLLADRAIDGLTVRRERLESVLERNPILVTALNPHIGYARGAELANQAYAEGRPIREVLREQSDLDVDELEHLLDPMLLTRGGNPG